MLSSGWRLTKVSSPRTQEQPSRCASEGRRIGHLRHYSPGVGHALEQRTYPAQRQPRILPARGRDALIVLPISGGACVRALGLPAAYPKDPADRIIGGTALVEALALLTKDLG